MRIVGGSVAQPDLPRVAAAAVVVPTPVVSSTPTVSPVSVPSAATNSFDVSKHIRLVPLFRETAIDS